MIDAILEFFGRFGRAALVEFLSFGWITGRADRYIGYAVLVILASIVAYLWITRGL
jgi:hypothetical protein